MTRTLVGMPDPPEPAPVQFAGVNLTSTNTSTAQVVRFDTTTAEPDVGRCCRLHDDTCDPGGLPGTDYCCDKCPTFDG